MARTRCSVADFGAIGDGETDNTDAFRAAVPGCEAAARRARHERFELTVPPGRWVTGAFNLTSHMRLSVARGAVVLAATDPARYPPVRAPAGWGVTRDACCVPWPTTPFPRARRPYSHAALVGGFGLRDVQIRGAGAGASVVDGRGGAWWARFACATMENAAQWAHVPDAVVQALPPFATWGCAALRADAAAAPLLRAGVALAYGRPRLVECVECERFELSGLTLKDSPFWTVEAARRRGLWRASEGGAFVARALSLSRRSTRSGARACTCTTWRSARRTATSGAASLASTATASTPIRAREALGTHIYSEAVV